MAGASEVAQLMPADQTVLVVVPDEDDDGGPNTQRGLDLLAVHQEAGVAGDRYRCALRMGQLRCDGPRHADPHRSETVRDDARVRALSLVEPGGPHLVRPHVADDDVLRPENLPEVREDALGHHGERRVLRMLGVLMEDEVPQRPELRLLLRPRHLADPLQGFANIADDSGGQDVVLIHFGRRLVYV